MFWQTSCSTGGRTGHRHGPRGGGRTFAYGPRGEFGGFPHGGRGGRRARRGDIRTAALLLLAEEPRNGYEIMQEVKERSGGMWSPSPGSVYPALAQLEDEGLIRTEENEGRKLFVVTDAGRELLAERGTDRPAPWEQRDLGGDGRDLGRLMREIAFAFAQVMRTGSPGQMARARELLDGVRRELYHILADGEGGERGDEEKGTPPGSGGAGGTVDEDS